jgi:hypothetical protein
MSAKPKARINRIDFSKPAEIIIRAFLSNPSRSGNKEKSAVSTIGKSSLTISAKPVGVGAAFQPLILAVERIFVGDAHRDDGQRFNVRADEKLTAFVELESAIRG